MAPGVTHADDLAYLFNLRGFQLTRAPDLALRDLFTKLWTNFADTGNPTPDSSLGFIWEPTTEAHLQHLVLSPSPFMQNDTRRQQQRQRQQRLPSSVLFSNYQSYQCSYDDLATNKTALPNVAPRITKDYQQ
nr:uncharacterized protein LOC128697979 [Cherax quadricarinatus]